MKVSNLFAKDVFIRLDGGDAFVATAKYGFLYTKTEQVSVDGEPSGAERTTAEVHSRYLVPPISASAKKRRGWETGF